MNKFVRGSFYDVYMRYLVAAQRTGFASKKIDMAYQARHHLWNNQLIGKKAYKR